VNALRQQPELAFTDLHRAQPLRQMQDQGSITVAAFRGLLGANRRWPVSRLADLHREGLSQHHGGLRVLPG
jgi:hypothetical protein